MATTPTFDPIFEHYLTGNVDDIKVYDPDDTENRVLPLGQPWKVEIYWSLEGRFVTALCGKWKIILSIEGMGIRLEADLCVGEKDFGDVEAGSTRLIRKWKFTCNVPSDKVTEEGVYMLTTFVSFIDSLGVPMPMAGHTDEPLISFYTP